MKIKLPFLCLFLGHYFDYGGIPEQKGQFFGGATAASKPLKLGLSMASGIVRMSKDFPGFWNSPNVQGLSRFPGQSQSPKIVMGSWVSGKDSAIQGMAKKNLYLLSRLHI